MNERPETCGGCALDPLATGFLRGPEGALALGVLLVGEALGEREAQLGRPFVGPAGRVLTDAIERAGFRRDQFMITNALCCQPPENKLRGEAYEYQAIVKCRETYLNPLIQQVQPRVLVPLGDTALFSLTGERGILDARGYVQWSVDYGCYVIPSVHPSFVQRGQTEWQTVLIHDLRRAVAVAQGGWKAYDDTDYLLDPLPVAAQQWAARWEFLGEPRISYDIETPDKDSAEDETDFTLTHTAPITRIGFAYREPIGGRIQAISFPWSGEYRGGVNHLLENGSEKVVWNAKFDNGRLGLQGVRIGGTIHDGMVAWHILHSDLKKSLGFVATFLCPQQPRWKHLSSARPAFYNAEDCVVELRCMERAETLLQETDLWAVYDRRVLQMAPIRAHMTQMGMPVDQGARRKAAEENAEELAAAVEKLQEVIPLDARPFRQLQRQPKVVKPLETVHENIAMVKVKRCPTCGKFGKLNKRHPCGVAFEELATPVPGWRVYAPFKGNSPVQVKAYAALKGHAGFKKTADEGAVRRVALAHPDDPVYPLILDERELKKISGTYIGYPDPADPLSVIGGMPVTNGRVHATFGLDPSTLRWNSAGPNLQNLPRPDERVRSRRARGMFITPPGWVFVKRDFSGIEALLVGYFAGDPRYMRLTMIDIHTFVMAHAAYELEHALRADELPEEGWDDAKLKAHLKDLRKRLGDTKRTVLKRIVHGRNYLMGPKKAQEVLFKDLGVLLPVKEIKALFEVMDNLFPSIPRWHEALCRRVDGMRKEEGPALGGGVDVAVSYVRNPFGGVHRFHQVLRWQRIGGKWEWEYGTGANALIAYLPQSTAAEIGDRALTSMWNAFPDYAQYLRAFIHDELLCEAPEDEADELDAVLREVLEQPHPELPLDPSWGFGDCLKVGTEGKIGNNWGAL